jgi:DNA-binding LacI/PurR family transcriptional regulator
MHVQRHDPRIVALKDAELPFVLIGQSAEETGLAYVDIDIDAAMAASLSHLTGLGHQRIACLHHDAPEFGFSHLLEGYRTHCAALGLVPVARPCGLSTESGRQAMAALLVEHPETTGVIVWNDLAAWGAIQAAAAAGRLVPADLSIVCVDQSNISNLVPFHPTLVDVRPADVSRGAAEMLLAALAGAPHGEGILLAPGFTVGETTGPAPLAGGSSDSRRRYDASRDNAAE